MTGGAVALSVILLPIVGVVGYALAQQPRRRRQRQAALDPRYEALGLTTSIKDPRRAGSVSRDAFSSWRRRVVHAAWGRIDGVDVHAFDDYKRGYVRRGGSPWAVCQVSTPCPAPVGLMVTSRPRRPDWEWVPGSVEVGSPLERFEVLALRGKGDGGRDRRVARAADVVAVVLGAEVAAWLGSRLDGIGGALTLVLAGTSLRGYVPIEEGSKSRGDGPELVELVLDLRRRMAAAAGHHRGTQH